MSFDALSLKILTIESSAAIIGRTVDKISENREKEFAFILRDEYSNSILYISINPNFPVYFHTGDMGMNLFNFNSNFSTVLRKYLCGARITGIETLYADRILVMRFVKKDAFSEKSYGVVFEFMGKHSNAFIYLDRYAPGTDAAVSPAPGMAALSHNDVIGFCHPSENLCEYISAPQKTDIRTIALQNLTVDAGVETASALVKTYTGLSPKLCGFIKTPEDLTAVSKLFLAGSKEELDGLISEKDKYPIFKYYNIGIYTGVKKPAASAHSLAPGGGAASKPRSCVYPFYAPDGSGESAAPVFCGSLNEAYRLFYNEYNIGVTAFYVEQKLLRLLDAAEKKLSVFNGEVEISRDFEKHSEYGKLLISYIASRENDRNSVGASSMDIYETSVPVDKKLSASANAQKHFKMHKKLRAKFCRARKVAAGYENMVSEINRCLKLLSGNSRENIPEIESSVRKIVPELISERSNQKKFLARFDGSVRTFTSQFSGHKKKEKKSEAAPAAHENNKNYRLFTSENGFSIYVGRSDTGNDHILSKVALPEDYWLHVKDFRGSSVIVKAPRGADIDAVESALAEAALYAAHYSEGRSATKIFVSCAKRKYVKKIKRVAGKVTYTNEKTILVDVTMLEKKFNGC